MSAIHAPMFTVSSSSGYSFIEPFDTLSADWVESGLGNFTVNTGKLEANDWGTGGSVWHGPTITHALPNIGDFDVTFSGIVITPETNDLADYKIILNADSGILIEFGFNDAYWNSETSSLIFISKNGNSIDASSTQDGFSGEIQIIRSGSTVIVNKDSVLWYSGSISTDALSSISITHNMYDSYTTGVCTLDNIELNGTLV